MNLGRLHSETKRRKIEREFLHVIGTVIFFLSFSSFTSFTAPTAGVQDADIHRHEKLQSISHLALDKNVPFLVGLEVEEIEESKEEKKDAASDLSTFESPNFIAANKHEFLKDQILVGNNGILTPKIPLYLLFRNVRIHTI